MTIPVVTQGSNFLVTATTGWGNYAPDNRNYPSARGYSFFATSNPSGTPSYLLPKGTLISTGDYSSVIEEGRILLNDSNSSGSFVSSLVTGFSYRVDVPLSCPPGLYTVNPRVQTGTIFSDAYGDKAVVGNTLNPCQFSVIASGPTQTPVILPPVLPIVPAPPGQPVTIPIITPTGPPTTITINPGPPIGTTIPGEPPGGVPPTDPDNPYTTQTATPVVTITPTGGVITVFPVITTIYTITVTDPNGITTITIVVEVLDNNCDCEGWTIIPGTCEDWSLITPLC